MKSRICLARSFAVTKDSPCDDSIKGVVLAHEKSEESDYRQGIIKVDSLGCFQYISCTIYTRVLLMGKESEV